MTINAPIGMKQAEIDLYVDYLVKKYNRKIETLNIELDGKEVILDFDFVKVPFERIRRITGYLVGTLGNWNDAKSAEERDRVKHELNERKEIEAL